MGLYDKGKLKIKVLDILKIIYNTDKMNISAVVLTKNEEKNIKDCLESLKWCEEILIVDNHSEDKTVEIAEKMGAKVLTSELNNDFSSIRNFALDKVKGEWVLFIDADERVSNNLISEILNIKEKALNEFDGFYIKRIDFMWGRELKHGETRDTRLLRLARRNKGEWKGKVHEEWKVNGKIGELKNPIFHYPHQSMSEFLREINFYTDIRSKELYEKGVKVNFFSIIAYPVGKFIQNYFFKLGFLDFMPGLIFAITMSFHSFLVRGKLWSLLDKKKNI